MNVLALCSGYGGLELGVDIAMGDARTICCVEREAYPVAISVEKMENRIMVPAPVWDDLTTFDGLPWRGKVHIVTAGFPCQPFSCAGQRRGADDERHIWPEIARIIREVRPSLVFLENVPGLLAMPAEFGTVLGDLAEAGLDAEWGVFSAAEVGASHQRKRLFILAYDSSIDSREIFGRKTEERFTGICEPKLADADNYGKGKRHGSNTVGEDETEIQGRRDKENSQNESADPDESNGELADDPTLQREAVERGESDGVLSGMVHTIDPRSCGDRPGGKKAGGSRGISDDGSAIEKSDGQFRPFPPGPAELVEWREILDRRPDLAPAVEPDIRRMADGTTTRVDRLRCLGNGVVPLQAAYAFTALADRLTA